MEVSLKQTNGQQESKTNLTISIFYFFFFFGLGSFTPLLSVYLNEMGLSGTQIGTVMSITPIVMIIAQPMWGMITDYTQKPRLVLTGTLITAAVIGLIYSSVNTFSILIFIAAMLSFFQSAVIPISDSLTISYVQRVKGNYGALRLWGAIGFAIAVLFSGRLSEIVSLSVIFYIFSITLFITAIIAWKMPNERSSAQVDLKKGVTTLFRMPRFVLFLLTTFMIFGPIAANNVYFGIFITDMGGTLTGVGIAFLLSAGSEAPFMKVAGNWIQRLGMLHILLIAGIISCLRWAFYFVEPSLMLVYATTIAQGVSVGLFIPAALQYVRDISPNSVRATAVSLYAAIGNGLGSWFCTYVGGVILETSGILNVYLFFTSLTLIGILTLFIIRYLDQKKKEVKNVA
ncbi:MFS transporter [Litchfieldia salsa]|uniref:MFS transporter, PPP family, 3-phenylpropionic acid transporter n=1 Tax=Litchfieldia salsa TaxID=930152 RepID=A0A1H0PAA7_9BACI|nr:major facilitator superfamily domain-containing protein 6 [Litchfieldia salsa]SDP01556.1 MFS transporter, PPP family, 3-phenylpropionic acid transporter [Litchfieldia salsa]